MSANDSTASALYTPRRSTRINRLDISAREVADLLASQDNSSWRIRRTPRKSALGQATSMSEAESSRSPVKHQSGGNKAQKNQKKRNKKSKKQKSKANQKRKEVKKVNSTSEDAEDESDVEIENGIGDAPTMLSEGSPAVAEPKVMEVEQVPEAEAESASAVELEDSPPKLESGIGESPTMFSDGSAEVAESKVVEQAPEAEAESAFAVELEDTPSKLESGIETMNTTGVVSSPESPAQSLNISRDEVINLITPEIMPKDTYKVEAPEDALEIRQDASEPAVVDHSPETPEEIIAVDAEKSSEDLNGTFEISQTEISAISQENVEISQADMPSTVPGENAEIGQTEMPSAIPQENVEISQTEMSSARENIEISQTEMPPAVPQEENLEINEIANNPQESVDQTVASKAGPRYSSTPARKSVADRKSTPFKPLSHSAKKAIMSAMESPTPSKIACLVASPSLTPVLLKFAKTPLKSAMRGNRRSMSVDMGVDLNMTTKKGVVFHSPSNTTIHIDEVDFIMKSKKKIDGKKKENVKGEVGRPRRSMSLVETESEKEFLRSLQPKMEEIDGNKGGKRDPTPKSRTKLPNFTAIHKQHFEKMESISDHVARKTERAKVLSASKPKSDKEPSGALKKDIKRLNQSGPKPIQSGPKARQRIELTSIKVNKATVEAIKSTVLNNKTVKPLTINKSNVLPKKVTDNKKPLDAKTTVKTAKPIVSAPIAATKEAPSKHPPTAPIEKKHISMFKSVSNSRTNTSVLHESRTEQQQFISGVRSNRRFVLQMQHRDKMK